MFSSLNVYTISSPFTLLYFGKSVNVYSHVLVFSGTSFAIVNVCLYGLFASFASFPVNTNVTSLGLFPATFALSFHTFVTGIEIVSVGTSNLFVIVFVSWSTLLFTLV